MILKNVRIVLKNDVIENGSLEIENGVIKGVFSAVPEHRAGAMDIMDFSGCTVMPGFIDVHIHGLGGDDTMDGASDSILGHEAERFDEESRLAVFHRMAKNLLKSGVTGFLGTTVSADLETLKRIIKNGEEARREQRLAYEADTYTEADLLGIHLEGPFLNKAAKGAQNERFIEMAEPDYLEDLSAFVRWITVAPEADPDMTLIKKAKEQGRIVSIGHSKADYELAKLAFQAGAVSVTHLFNGMSGLHHREPGIPGAAFDTPEVYTEIIPDGLHLHPAILRLVLKVKGADRVLVVTDAMRGQSMKTGVYDLGGLSVKVDGKSARLSDGTLAGSVLTMDQAFRNLRDFTDLTLPELAAVTSGNQARLLGLTDRGEIKEGNRADLVVMDKQLNIRTVIKSGKCI